MSESTAHPSLPPKSGEHQSSLTLRNFIKEVFDKTVEFVAKHFGPLSEETKPKIWREVENAFFKIPQRELLDTLESKKDPTFLVEEAFDLLDSSDSALALKLKAGDLKEKGLAAFTEPGQRLIIRNILASILGTRSDVLSNYPSLFEEIRYIHALLKTKSTLKQPFREEEVVGLATKLVGSLIDVEKLIEGVRSRSTAGQYL